MGSITTGIGLISGINSAQLIDSLIALESRGKVNLQQRVAVLQTQRTALLDISARLLNMKTAARAFRVNKVFQAARAASSDETALTASAASSTPPGLYQFIVKQLVGTSQKLSKGFADKTVTPLGLTSIGFEWGRGALQTDRDLEQLNGGAGVRRGLIVITDKSGAQATIDLSDVTTLNETLDRINAAAGVSVSASAHGDHLVVTDGSGGGGSLTIADAPGSFTATDLGISGTTAGASITGTDINTIGTSTALASLNDGNGVLTRTGVPDLRITARDGTAIDVDLGRVNAPITGATLLSALNNGLGVTLSDDPDNPDIKFIDRDGVEHDVNLTGVTTVGGLISRVSAETAGRIQLSIHADGDKLTVTDTVGGAGLLRVTGAGVNAAETAQDLGILNVAGVASDSFNGQHVPNTITDPPAATIGQVIARINAAQTNGGRIIASIGNDGVSLLLTDTTSGAGNLIVSATAGNAYAASALGIETAPAGVAASTIGGQRLIASLGSALVRNLNGGAGLGSATSIQITDRNGASFSLNNLDGYASASDLLNAINNEAIAQGVDVTIGFNTVGNGLLVTDSSGGTGSLIVSGDAAEALGIDGSVAANSIRGANLQLRYVSNATRLSDLNYGRGIGLGRFEIRDALGATAVVDIASDSVTLHDIIQEINSRGLAITSRVNDTGDGLLIESDLGPGQSPVVPIKVTSLAGTTARDLNILGQSSTVESAVINGSYERSVELAESDTLQQVVNKINAAGIPVSASIVNTGSGAVPFRASFTSAISGRLGELAVDSGNFDFELAALARGRDAKVFFGGATPQEGFLITSSSNTVTGVVEGLTVNLLKAGADPVTVTVERDTESILASVQQLVTTFNDVVGRIKQYDYYNVETKAKGPLLGHPATARIRDGLFRVLQGRAQGVTTQFQSLQQVGITVDRTSQLHLDQDKFLQAYENDPQAVENLFAAFQAPPSTPVEIFPGVTVPSTPTTATVRGFGELFANLLEGMTDTTAGSVTLADHDLRDRIDLANKRIGEFDARLEAKRARLQAQFNGLEAALARLQGQGNAIGGLAGNLLLAQSALASR